MFILFITAFVGFCELELKLDEKGLDRLYTVRLKVGEAGNTLNALIDLYGNDLIVPCSYSYSEDKQLYLPYLSTSSHYKDNKNQCMFEIFNKSIDHEFCEHSFEFPPGQEIKASMFKDSVSLGSEKITEEFFCVKKTEQITKDAYPVLGLGPNSKILSMIYEKNYYSKNFKIFFDPNNGTLSIGVKSTNLKQEKNLEIQEHRYTFRISSIIFPKSTNLTLKKNDFSLNSMSKYSYISIQDYFSLQQHLRSSISSDPSITITRLDSRDCFANKSSKVMNITMFPKLTFNLTSDQQISWKSSEYLEKINENFYCLGIFPSFSNVLGLNFLRGRSVTVDLVHSQISFSDKSPLEQSPYDNLNKNSNSTGIIMICLFVILLQIVAGYYFLKKNRNSSLQRPNIELSQVELE